jgi:diguanylate cyclase (GGDEF)-like protein
MTAPPSQPENTPKIPPQSLGTADGESDLAAINAALRHRVSELEDFKRRVEADAQGGVENGAEGSAALEMELAVARDEAETARRQAEEYRRLIDEMALHDPLTGVANRNELRRRYDEAVKIARRGSGAVALLRIDLDGLDDINAASGDPVGDALLQFAAGELVRATRDTDTVARPGGNEFVVLLSGLDRDERAVRVAERILNIFARPVTLCGCTLKAGACIGISLYPRDSRDLEDLLHTAGEALDRAKSYGRGSYRFFDRAVHRTARATHTLENEMRWALDRGEFVLHYQPQLDAAGQHITGAEALVRWQHPTRGLLYPGDFLAEAESSGLIEEIGRAVLAAACEQGKAWDAQGLNGVRIAVNVSARQFRHEGFVRMVEGALVDSGLDPDRLELEITEALMLERIEVAAETLQQLRVLGVDVAVDDFGAGYSSLAYLKHLPISKLKLDHTLTRDLGGGAGDSGGSGGFGDAGDSSGPGDPTVAGAIIHMGHTLGHTVLAKGVESRRQSDSLRGMGCDEMQGFLYSKPLPANDFAKWHTAHGRTAHGGTDQGSAQGTAQGTAMAS